MKIKYVLYSCILLFFIHISSTFVYGAESESEISENIDFSQIDVVLKEASGSSFTFQQIVVLLMKGDVLSSIKMIGNGLMESLFKELKGNRMLMIQVISIVIFSSVFTNLSSAFSNHTVGEAGFFVTYLMLITILSTAYGISFQLTRNVIENLLEFMKVFLIAFCMSVTAASGVSSSTGLYIVLMLAITSVNYLILTVLLPLSNFYFILQIVDRLGEEQHFSKLSAFVKKAIEWSLRILFSAITGVQVLQSLLLPAIDSVKSGVIKKGVTLIPGAGQAMAAVFNTMLGAGVIVKNSIGIAGLLCILLLIGIPIIKLVVVSISYEWLIAMMQPIADKRMIACIQGVSQGIALLLKMIWVISTLFLLSLVIAIASTNMKYMS